MVSMSRSIPHSWRMLLYWGWRANHSFSLTRVISASQSFSFSSVPSFPGCWQNEWRKVLGLSFSFDKIKTLKNNYFSRKNSLSNSSKIKLIKSRKRRSPLVQPKETRFPPTALSLWIVYNHKSLCKRYGLSIRFQARASYSHTGSMSQRFLWTSLLLRTFKRTFSCKNGSLASPKCAFKW